MHLSKYIWLRSSSSACICAFCSVVFFLSHAHHMSAGHTRSHTKVSLCYCVHVLMYMLICVYVFVCREAISRLCARTLLKTAVKTKKVRLVYTDRHTLIFTHSLFLAHSAGITVFFVIISLFARDYLLFWVRQTCSFLEEGSSSLSPPTV